MKKSLAVSVIIPVYNGERYLAEAIDSILEQTVSPGEVIVVDDGSTDNTARVVAGYGDAVRYTYQSNGGTAAARNRGIQLARGNLVAFLDADDLWVADKLERQLEVLDQNPGVDMVFGQIEQFVSPDVEPQLAERIKLYQRAQTGISGSVMLARREVFDRAGYFDTSRKMFEFVDWYARAQDQDLCAFVLPELVAQRRIHGKNQSLAYDIRKTEYPAALKAILDRRRKAGDADD